MVRGGVIYFRLLKVSVDTLKRFAKGHSRKHRKSHIPYRIPINERPKYIEKRVQPGHWEADGIVH